MKKFLLLLITMFLPFIGEAANRAALYVGETTIFAAPNPPSGSAINQTAWACSNANVSVENMGIQDVELKYFHSLQEQQKLDATTTIIGMTRMALCTQIMLQHIIMSHVTLLI